jgi:protease II
LAEDVGRSIAWGDDETLYYITFDETHRADKVRATVLTTTVVKNDQDQL